MKAPEGLPQTILNIYLTKCVASVIDTSKRAKFALCGMDRVDVANCIVINLGISFFNQTFRHVF